MAPLIKLVIISLLFLFSGLPLTYSSETYAVAREIAPQSVVGMSKYELKGTKYKEPPESLKTIIEEKAGTYGIDHVLMKTISFCESDYRVSAVNKNTNLSNDGGPAQINSVHLPELERLGLDRFNPEDAYEFMAILIKRNGTRDYNSSKKCWQIALKVASK